MRDDDFEYEDVEAIEEYGEDEEEKEEDEEEIDEHGLNKY